MADSLLDDVCRMATGWRWTRQRLVPNGAIPRAGRPPTIDWARAALAQATREIALGAALGPLLETALDVSVAGREYLDRVQPPVVFVANHASHLDGLLLLHALPVAWRRRTVVAAAADYFFDTWWRSTLSALALNAVPVQRYSGSGEQVDLVALLSGGWSVLTFPEGTRSRDGSLQRLHHGASRLALAASRPVVPVAIRGTFLAMPPGARWPRRTRVHLRFGTALAPLPEERTRDLTARIAAALQLLLAEDATTWWSALHAAQQPAPASRWRRAWASTRPLQPNARPSVWPRP
jgi:1-acyl-sn-glycerol-3-phosphate acyltransferase